MKSKSKSAIKSNRESESDDESQSESNSDSDRNSDSMLTGILEARRRFRCAPGIGMSSCGCQCGLDYSRVSLNLH